MIPKAPRGLAVAGAAIAGLVLLIPQIAAAKFAHLPSQAVEEVPIARLLANIEADRSGLSPAEKARAVGRLHLLAYLRHTRTLPVLPGDDGPGDLKVAEGEVADCATLNAAFGPETQQGRCLQREYTIGQRPELPAHVGATRTPPDIDLKAAVAAYRKARALEPRNLRTRVALAFCLARAGQESAARSELRFAARTGLAAIASMRADEHNAAPNEATWANTIVLGEVEAALSELAHTPAERRLAAELRARTATMRRRVLVTPILVPLRAGLAFEDLINASSAVAFDFTGQGPALRGGWPTADAAWLVWDPQARGRIHSGFQLFGSATWVASWDSGYRPLGALDDNADGRLSGRELDGLALWRDADGDGVSEPGEVTPVAKAGIEALAFDYRPAGAGLWISPAGVTFQGGETRPTFDWTVRGDAAGDGT